LFVLLGWLKNTNENRLINILEHRAALKEDNCDNDTILNIVELLSKTELIHEKIKKVEYNTSNANLFLFEYDDLVSYIDEIAKKYSSNKEKMLQKCRLNTFSTETLLFQYYLSKGFPGECEFESKNVWDILKYRHISGELEKKSIEKIKK